MIGDQVLPLVERDAVELSRREEHAVLQYPLGLEPRAQGCGVDVVLRRSHLLGVEGPVVRLERERLGLGLIDDRLESLLLGADVGCRGRSETVQKIGDGLRRPRGLVRRHVRRVRGVAEQSCTLGAERDDLGEHSAVVVRIAPSGP